MNTRLTRMALKRSVVRLPICTLLVAMIERAFWLPAEQQPVRRELVARARMSAMVPARLSLLVFGPRDAPGHRTFHGAIGLKPTSGSDAGFASFALGNDLDALVAALHGIVNPGHRRQR